MNIACVIGNGTSRKQFDLHCINATMKTYGCNALYREFVPDVLISMDIFMVCEIIENDIHRQSKFYTQHCNKMDELAEIGEPIHFCKIERSTQDSGTSAIELASMNNDIVYLIGFDYDTGDGILPNVYHGSKNYPRSSCIPAATDMANRWKQRLRKLVKEYPNTQFIRVNGSNTEASVSATNYSEITPEQFKEIYDSRN